MKDIMYDESILIELKKYFDRINYHLLLTIILGEETYFVNPLPEYKIVKQNLLKLDPKLRSIIEFFMLGEPISRDILDSEIGTKIVDYLYKIEIINKDPSHYWLNNYVLTSYSNCYVLVSNVYYYPTCQSKEQKPYIGIDSYWLSRIIVNRVSGNVLDLCTGSGLQAIIAAKTADKVVAVDIDIESAKIASFNICLNGVSSKIKLLVGDLYDNISQDEKFDYIISNPPFIPIPNNVNFHICGDGGEDGTTIIKRIISGFKTFLKPSGETIMIGQCIGTFNHALIQDVVEKEIPSNRYSLYLHKKTILESQAVGFTELANMYNGEKATTDEWINLYRKYNVGYLHTFSLFTYGINGDGTIVNIDDTWSKDAIPVVKFSSLSELVKIFAVTNNQKQTWAVEEETAAFLNLIDGKMSLQEIVNKMPLKYKLKNGKNSVINLLVKYCMICSQLERQKIIEKANRDKTQI